MTENRSYEYIDVKVIWVMGHRDFACDSRVKFFGEIEISSNKRAKDKNRFPKVKVKSVTGHNHLYEKIL